MRIHSGGVNRTEFIESLEPIVRSWNRSLLNKYLLNIDCAAGTVLGAESTTIKQIRCMFQFLESLHYWDIDKQ